MERNFCQLTTEKILEKTRKKANEVNVCVCGGGWVRVCMPLYVLRLDTGRKKLGNSGESKGSYVKRYCRY